MFLQLYTDEEKTCFFCDLCSDILKVDFLKQNDLSCVSLILFQVSTFIMMYRTHCQRILDTVIRANFDEVCLETAVAV